jgi:hypothetical protein
MFERLPNWTIAIGAAIFAILVGMWTIRLDQPNDAAGCQRALINLC